jgi:glucosamine kinase
MTSLLLGLDGGGTQTRAAVATLDRIILGRGGAGACNLAAVSPAEALAAALDASDAALQEAGAKHADIAAVCAGVAGVSYAERRRLFHAGLQSAFPQAQVAVEPDYAIALAGATRGGPGVIVIAGTGSAAYGENAAGESHKTGAYGYLIDDSGSGYGVGRAALAAALRAADGTGEPTSLGKHILETLQFASLAEIVPGVYGGGLSRVTIASLSRVVAEAAREDDDAVARAILMRAGGALAHLVHGITQRIFADADTHFPVSAIGGLWNTGDILTDVFTRSLHRFAPQSVLGPPQLPPVEGALLHAACLQEASQKNCPAS